MTSAEPRFARPATWIAVAASLVFASFSAWEVGAPLEGGHWASMAGCGIAAENLLRFHQFAAVTHYSPKPPPGYGEYVCRHPYGIYLMEALSRALFGHHAWALRIPAIVCSAATPWVMYGLGRALWGPWPAVVATVAFVVVPIDLAFAMFSSLEVPTILFGLVFCLGTVRVWERGRRRDLAVATAGALGASQSDWIGAVLVASVVALALARRYALPHTWRRPHEPRLDGRWVTAAIVAAMGTVALYAVLAIHAGQIGDVLGGAKLRYGRHDLPWGVTFNPTRLMRLEWMVPAVGLVAVVAAVPVALVRARTRPGELLLPAWSFMASLQYFLFKQGADIHIFWPHYFGPCVALALGTLTDALLAWPVGGALAVARVPALALFVGFPIALTARVGLPALGESRLTQGRFDERGHYIESGAAPSAFAEWATRDLASDAVVRCTTLCSWNVEYATRLAQEDGPVVTTPRTPADRDRIELVDARYTPTSVLRTLTETFDAAAVGPFLRIDRSRSASGVRAMRFDERQPSGWERLLVTDHDLVRSVGAEVDPWETWEWADTMGHSAPAPDGEPTSLDALRVAHNIAWSRGDHDAASALRRDLLATVGGGHAVAFTNDVRLLSSTIEEGPATVVTLLWEAGESFRPVDDTTFAVRCRVTQPPPLWPAPIATLEKDLAPPMTWKPSLWRPGYLYLQRFVALPGFGTEACRGYFVPNVLHPSTGTFDVELFALQ